MTYKITKIIKPQSEADYFEAFEAAFQIEAESEISIEYRNDNCVHWEQ